MSSDPLVSVVIPTFNRAHTISETIDSVLAQTYPRLEIIVVDDGSEDATSEVLGRYGSRIKVLSQQNAGQMVARNRGISMSTGEIITFLDSDDIWLTDCVRRHVQLLERLDDSVPCTLANGWMEFSDGRRITSFENSGLKMQIDEGLWVNVPNILPTRFVMFCQFAAVRRQALLKVGGFDVRLKYMEDYALPLKLSVLGFWGIVREPLVVWRQGNAGTNSISQRAIRQPKELRESLIAIRKDFLAETDGKVEFREARRLQKRELHNDRLEMNALEMRERGVHLWSDLVMRGVRYRRAISRRLPNHAKPKIVPV